jgi:hypothetical protein
MGEVFIWELFPHRYAQIGCLLKEVASESAAMSGYLYLLRILEHRSCQYVLECSDHDT